MFLITVREDGHEEAVATTPDGDRVEAYCKKKNDLTTDEVSFEYRAIQRLEDIEDDQLTRTIHDPRDD